MAIEKQHYEIVKQYVENNLPVFHENRIQKLLGLDLLKVLKRKNPYLFRAKNPSTASEFIETILHAYLSSQEETLFGGFLEGLAIQICDHVYGGKKSSAEGMDLEFSKDDILYIVSIKSGPNWGNSSQINKMKDNFRKAKRILGTNRRGSKKVVAVNGCCYGKDNNPEKDEYLKLCGERFWDFISGIPSLYIDIIEPLGHEAKERNDLFMEEYGKVVNKFTRTFLEGFCDDDGAIRWSDVVKFGSAK